jgi:hypothetical protein
LNLNPSLLRKRGMKAETGDLARFRVEARRRRRRRATRTLSPNQRLQSLSQSSRSS